MIKKPEYLKGKVQDFIDTVTQENFFELQYFFNQPFQLKMVVEYFKGWEQYGTTFENTDVGEIIYYETLRSKWSLENYKVRGAERWIHFQVLPITLAHFITNYLQTGMQLEWN